MISIMRNTYTHAYSHTHMHTNNIHIESTCVGDHATHEHTDSLLSGVYYVQVVMMMGVVVVVVVLLW